MVVFEWFLTARLVALRAAEAVAEAEVAIRALVPQATAERGAAREAREALMERDH